MFDVMVVGGGMAGRVAASAAAEENCNTLLISKGPGTVYLSTGSVDLMGYNNQGQELQNPWQWLEQLAEGQHPYGLTTALEIKEVIEYLKRVLNKKQTYYAECGENTWLPTALGTRRPGYLLPQSQVAGDLTRTEPILLISWPWFRDFFPHLAAERLRVTLAKFGSPLEVEACQLDWQPVQASTNLTAYDVANLLAQPENWTSFVQSLQSVVRPGWRLGLPAILGSTLAENAELHKQLEHELGIPVFEIPILPPSLPGIRLYKALMNHIQSLGVEVVQGSYARHLTQDGQNLSLTVEAPGGQLLFRGKGIVLATGGVFSGGITHLLEDYYQEPITKTRLESPGIAVNSNQQFLTKVPQGVWVAGQMLAGYNPYEEKNGLGVAAVTGYRAGKLAARQVVKGGDGLCNPLINA